MKLQQYNQLTEENNEKIKHSPHFPINAIGLLLILKTKNQSL